MPDHVCHENVATLSRINSDRACDAFFPRPCAIGINEKLIPNAPRRTEKELPCVFLSFNRAPRANSSRTLNYVRECAADLQNANCGREEVRIANLRALIRARRGWLPVFAGTELTFLL